MLAARPRKGETNKKNWKLFALHILHFFISGKIGRAQSHSIADVAMQYRCCYAVPLQHPATSFLFQDSHGFSNLSLIPRAWDLQKLGRKVHGTNKKNAKWQARLISVHCWVPAMVMGWPISFWSRFESLMPFASPVMARLPYLFYFLSVYHSSAEGGKAKASPCGLVPRLCSQSHSSIFRTNLSPQALNLLKRGLSTLNDNSVCQSIRSLKAASSVIK